MTPTTLEAIGQQLSDEEMYERAAKVTPQDDDRSYDTTLLKKNMKPLIEANIDVLLERECNRIISAVSRPNHTQPYGQMSFDFGTEDYEPKRLIRSDDNRVVELRHAPLSFLQSHSRRVNKNAERQRRAADHWMERVDKVTTWIVGELQKGRPMRELVYETFGFETGRHTPPTPGMKPVQSVALTEDIDLEEDEA